MSDKDIHLNEKSLIDLKKLLASEQGKYEALNYCMSENDNEQFSISFNKKFIAMLNTKLDIYSNNNLSVSGFRTELFSTSKAMLPTELYGKITFNEEQSQILPKQNLSDIDKNLYNDFALQVNYSNNLVQHIFAAVYYKQMGDFEGYNKSILNSSISENIAELDSVENFTEKHLTIDALFDKKRFSELSEEQGMSEYNQYFSARIIGAKILGMRLFSANYDFKFVPQNFITVQNLDNLTKVSEHLGLKEQLNRKEFELNGIFTTHVGVDAALSFSNALETAQLDFFNRLNLNEVGVDINEGKRGYFR